MNTDKYIKLLKGKTSQELEQLLKQAYRRIAELENRAAGGHQHNTLAALTKGHTSAAAQRQREASMAGQLKAEKLKLEAIQRSIKAMQNAVRAAHRKQAQEEAKVKSLKNYIKKFQPKLTKEQVFEMYRNANQTRFWDRITQGHQFNPQKLAEMKAKVATWDDQKLRDVIRMAGWRSTWYDSDAQWYSDETANWDEESFYAFIMSA